MTCSKTANSNGELTIEILEEVILPGIGVSEGKIGDVLVDDFRGHSRDIVNEFTMIFKSENENKDDAKKYSLCAFEIMRGGVIPKAQPIDAFVGNVCKGNYRDHYDIYMRSALLNMKGQPIPPSRQLCAEWVVQAWNKIPKELIQKSWDVCGYKSINELQNREISINNIVTEFNVAQMVQIMESAGGSDTIPSLDDPDNDIHDPDTDEEHMEGIRDIISK